MGLCVTTISDDLLYEWHLQSFPVFVNELFKPHTMGATRQANAVFSIINTQMSISDYTDNINRWFQETRQSNYPNVPDLLDSIEAQVKVHYIQKCALASNPNMTTAHLMIYQKIHSDILTVIGGLPVFLLVGVVF